MRPSARLVRLARGRVHHQLLVIGFLQGKEQRIEMPPVAPAGKALVDLGPSTQTRRQVTPGSTCLGDPQDRINEQPVISPGAAQYGGKVGDHALPLGIGEGVALLCHEKCSKVRSYLNTASITGPKIGIYIVYRTADMFLLYKKRQNPYAYWAGEELDGSVCMANTIIT